MPSGRSHRLDYGDDGTVAAAVKLQELFGLAETPRVGPSREPVVLSLLAPNGRPVQVTRDLRSFWDRTYPEVRKELRGRYPKHPWPRGSVDRRAYRANQELKTQSSELVGGVRAIHFSHAVAPNRQLVRGVGGRGRILLEESHMMRKLIATAAVVVMAAGDSAGPARQAGEPERERRDAGRQ